jgi:hypothetical protein
MGTPLFDGTGERSVAAFADGDKRRARPAH